MAAPKVKFKRSSVANKRPSLSNLESGELALNTYDGKLFTRQDTGGVGIATTVTVLNPWDENYGGESITYAGIQTSGGGITTDFSTVTLSGLSPAGFNTTYTRQSTGFVLDTGTVASGNALFDTDSNYYYYVDSGNNSRMLIFSESDNSWVGVASTGGGSPSTEYNVLTASNLSPTSFNQTYTRQVTGFILDTGTVASGNAIFRTDSSHYYYVASTGSDPEDRIVIWSEEDNAWLTVFDFNDPDFREGNISNGQALGSSFIFSATLTSNSDTFNSRNVPDADSSNVTYDTTRDYTSLTLDAAVSDFDGAYTRQSFKANLDTGSVSSGNALFNATSDYWWFLKDGDNSKMIIFDSVTSQWTYVGRTGADFSSAANNTSVGSANAVESQTISSVTYEADAYQPDANYSEITYDALSGVNYSSVSNNDAIGSGTTFVTVTSGKTTADSRFVPTASGSIVYGTTNVGVTTSRVGVVTFTTAGNLILSGIVTARTGVRVTAGGLVVSNGGLNVTGVSTFNDNVTLLDNDKLKLGTGGDLEIYHDGSHSYIDDAGTGNLNIRSGTLSIKNLAGSKTSAVFNSGGAQEFYFNNTKRLETTSTGALVTGILTATSFSGDGSDLTNVPHQFGILQGDFRIGSGYTDFKFTGAGVSSIVGSGNTVTIDIPASTIRRQVETSSGVTTNFTITDGYGVGFIDVYLNGVKQRSGTDYLAVSGTGVTMTPAVKDGDVLEFQVYENLTIASQSDPYDGTEGQLLQHNGSNFVGIGSTAFSDHVINEGQGYYAYTTDYYTVGVANTTQEIVEGEWTLIQPQVASGGLYNYQPGPMFRCNNGDPWVGSGATIGTGQTEFSLAGTKPGTSCIVRSVFRFEPDTDETDLDMRLHFTTNTATQGTGLTNFNIEKQALVMTVGAAVTYTSETLISFFVGDTLAGDTKADAGSFCIEVNGTTDGTLEILGVTVMVDI